MDITKLELSTETLRQLTDDELKDVAGGVQLTGTETYHCPTQGQLAACDTVLGVCAK
jgi:hypothetical protein